MDRSAKHLQALQDALSYRQLQRRLDPYRDRNAWTWADTRRRLAWSIVVFERQQYRLVKAF